MDNKVIKFDSKKKESEEVNEESEMTKQIEELQKKMLERQTPRVINIKVGIYGDKTPLTVTSVHTCEEDKSEKQDVTMDDMGVVMSTIELNNFAVICKNAELRVEQNPLEILNAFSFLQQKQMEMTENIINNFIENQRVMKPTSIYNDLHETLMKIQEQNKELLERLNGQTNSGIIIPK